MVENSPDEVVYYGAARFIVLDNLTSGLKYTYHVRATNLVGDGPWSDQYTFLMVNVPSQPLNLRVLKFDDTYVSFAWDQPLMNGGQALSGFNIYRQDCTNSVGEFVLLTDTPASQFNYIDTSITGGRTYNYVLTSYNVLGGESIHSNNITVTPIREPSGMTAPTEVTHD